MPISFFWFSEIYHVTQEPRFTVSMEKMGIADFICCFEILYAMNKSRFEQCPNFRILKSNSIEILTHSLMNVVFLERSTRTSSASSRFLVITLIEIQGIQIVSQPKHFSPQPIHPETNEYGFDYRHGRSIHPQNYCILALCIQMSH